SAPPVRPPSPASYAAPASRPTRDRAAVVDRPGRARQPLADATDGLPRAAARARVGTCTALSGLCLLPGVFPARAARVDPLSLAGAGAPSWCARCVSPLSVLRNDDTRPGVPDGQAHRAFRLPCPRRGRAARCCREAGRLPALRRTSGKLRDGARSGGDGLPGAGADSDVRTKCGE